MVKQTGTKKGDFKDDSYEKFLNDFILAWTKVMNLDRFDIR